MAFDIMMKSRQASDRNTILTQYQNVKPALGKNTLYSQNIPAPEPAPRLNPVNPYQNPAGNSRQRSAVAPRPVSGGGVSLQRGEKFTVSDTNGTVPANLKLLFRWNVQDSRCDLDASAFLLDSQDKVMNDDWFIFYGHQVSPDSSLRYSGNTGTGAEMQIHLQKVSPSVQKIALAVTIYEAFERHLHFGMVQSLEASIINADTNHELAHFALTDCSQSVTAMVVGELYRYKGAWKFSAVGSGVYRDLAGFCGMYGIETG